MSKWREVRFKDAIHFNPKVKLEKYNNYPNIGIADIDESSFYVYENEILEYKGQGGSKFETGDVLFSRITPCLENRKIARVFLENSDRGFGSTELFVFRGKKDYTLTSFVSYLAQTDIIVLPAINSMTGASGRQRAEKSFIEKLKIKIPDLKTQEKIADILSTYDRLIENNNRRIEILEKTAEEIYKEWFVRMRFPGHENTKFIKGIPEGWEVKRVGDLAKFKRGKNLVIRDAIPGEVPVIAGGMEPSCYHNESNTDAPVITVSASGANAGYTQLNNVDIWASDCSYIDINDTDLVYYIYLLLKVSHKEILNLQLGSAQPHVYARDLNNFKFLKPDRKLIKEINSYAKDIFEKIKYLSSTNQNLIKQRDLLLPRLMNGTIEVK